MEKLLNILNEIKPDVDFTKEAALITDNIFGFYLDYGAGKYA